MNESWQQLIATWPFLGVLAEYLCIILVLSALFAFSGLLFISVTAKILYIVRQRAAFDKCSRQIARLAMILGWILLIGSRIWLYLAKAEHAQDSVDNFILEISWLLLSLGVLLSTVYFTVWGVLKKMPVLHVTLGVISAVQNCITLIAILFTVRIYDGHYQSLADPYPLPEFLPASLYEPVWSAIIFTFPLIIAIAGAYAAFWIMVKRKNDDYGRDFYNSMLPWCSAWARNAWGILWLLFLAASSLQIWNAWQKEEFDYEFLLVTACENLVWFVPLILWTIVKKSVAPMRHKWAVVLALLVAITFMVPYFKDITLM